MFDWLLGFLGGLLYPLFSIIFVCLDGLQAVFFALAGVGNVSFGIGNRGAGQPITGENTGGETETGLIYYLFNNNLVKNLLLSIMLLALFLIIIFTVVAFIKNAYAAQQKNWKVIIGNAIKGLGNFILLPVVCLFAVWLANILLQAINGATSGGGTTQMSRKLFVASSYNANVFRNGKKGSSDWEELKTFAVSCGYEQANSIKEGLTSDEYANIVDDIYATTTINIGSKAYVESWYSLIDINYLVLVVGGVFMFQALGSIAYSMIKRLFMLIILFVVSPGICALYPLDEGAAVKTWSGEVKKHVLSAHGSVAAINIFFAIMPLIDNLHFFGTAGAIASLDDLMQLFILTVGLLCVSDFTGLLSNFIGGNDSFAQGKSQITNAAGKIGKNLVGAAVASKFIGKGAAKVGKAGWGLAKSGGKMIGKGAQSLGAGVGSIGHDIGDFRKARKDAKAQSKGFKDYNDMKEKKKQDKYEDKIQKKAEKAGLTINDYKSKLANRKDKLNNFKQHVSDFGHNVSDFGHKIGDGVKGGVNWAQHKVIEGSEKLKDTKVIKTLNKAGEKVKDKAKDVGLGDAVSEAGKAGKGFGKELLGQASILYDKSGLAGKVKKLTDPLKEVDKYYDERTKGKAKKQEAAKAAEAASVAATEKFEEKTAAAQAAKADRDAAAAKLKKNADGSLNTNKVSAAQLEVLRIQAGATNAEGFFTKEAETAQQTLKDAVMSNALIDSYLEKDEKAQEAEEEAKAAAEALQSKLEAAAETFKGGMKDAAENLAKNLKNAIDTNTISSGLVESLKEALKKISPNHSSTLGKESKEISKVLKDILKELKNK